MGQSHDKIKTSPATRVIFDKKGNNGFTICGRDIPTELLAEIFCRVDLKTLLNCQLVCKRWWIVIQNYIWRKKTELTLGKPFPRREEIPWHAFYLICKRKPFERNLLKNHSGEQNMKHWEICNDDDWTWMVLDPYMGEPDMPLTEPIFEGKEICFVTLSNNSCTKRQLVDLVAEGLHPYILDVLQPPIVVSEWYSCEWYCPVVYEIHVELLACKEKDNRILLLDKFQFRETIEGERQNQWLHISHVFENYGAGLRKINFLHGGMNRSSWPGIWQNGCKMAGACICVKIPPVTTYTYDDESDTPSILDE